MLIPFGVFSAAGAGGGAAGAYELISSQILTGTAASVTFSSLPAGYKHLQIRYTGRSTQVAAVTALGVRFNAATTNYTAHRLYGDGSTVWSESDVNTYTYMRTRTALPGANATASIFGAGVVDVLDYGSTTKNKTIRTLAGSQIAIGLHSGVWVNTAAITSVTLLPESDSFATGSRFSIYGIKGA